MRTWALAWIAAAAGCGRIGFDGPGGDDGPELPEGLVAWYPMDRIHDGDDGLREDANDPVRDASGHDHDGACDPARLVAPRCPIVTAGRVDAGYRFDGAAMIVVDSAPDLLTPAGFTVTAWLRLDAQQPAARACVATKGLSTGIANSWALCVEPSRQLFFYTVGGGQMDELKTGAAASDQIWHHAAIRWDGATKQVFLDGVEVARSTAAIDFDGQTIRIGGDLDGGSPIAMFPGDLDEVGSTTARSRTRSWPRWRGCNRSHSPREGRREPWVPLYHRPVRARLAPWLLVCASCGAELDDSQIVLWGEPVAVPGASSGTAQEDDVTLSSSGNELFFAVEQASAGKDLFVMTRAGAGAPWSSPVPLPFNTTATEETPRLSADDRTLYFGSTRTGGIGSGDIWMVMRSEVGGTWGPPQPVPGVNTTGYEKWLMPCEANGTYVMVQNRNAGTGTDVVEGTLGGAAVVVDALSSSENETGPFLTADCLTIYFASVRGGTNDIYRSRRVSLEAPWPAPTVVEDFGVVDNESDPWEAADRGTFAFTSDKAGTNDIYLCTRQ